MFVNKETGRRDERRLQAFLILICLVGCTGQGEGELCNHKAGNSGNDDCQSGLTCTTSGPSPGFGLCCPSNAASATTEACKGGSGGLDASVAPPSVSKESGPAEAGADATVEASPPDASAPETAEGGDGGPSEASAPEAAVEAAGPDATGSDVAAPDAAGPDATGSDADAADARME